jgi:hypothetical protein
MSDRNWDRLTSPAGRHLVAARSDWTTDQTPSNSTRWTDALLPDGTRHRHGSVLSHRHDCLPLHRIDAVQDHSGRWSRNPAADDARPLDGNQMTLSEAHRENHCYQRRSHLETRTSPIRLTISGPVDQRFAVAQCPSDDAGPWTHRRPPRADLSEMDDRMNGVAVAAT